MNTCQDFMWLHLGKRVPAHVADVADRADGVVIVGTASRGNVADVLARTEITIRQHDGPSVNDSLFPEDESWLLAQSQQSAFTAPVTYLGVPDSPADGLKRLQEAAVEAGQFLRLASCSDAAKPRMCNWALHPSWLRRPQLRRDLIAALSQLDGQAAIMLVSKGDPLSSTATVAGLVEAAQELRNRLILLRSDHGAVGAYAFGAAGGSIGLSSTYRHFTLPGQPGFRNDDPSPRVFWPRIMTWWAGSHFGLTSADDFYDCHCNSCGGVNLARFQDEAFLSAADMHSVECWASLAEQVRRRDQPQREQWWMTQCRDAMANLQVLEDRHGILQHPSKQLRAWCEATGIPVW